MHQFMSSYSIWRGKKDKQAIHITEVVIRKVQHTYVEYQPNIDLCYAILMFNSSKQNMLSVSCFLLGLCSIVCSFGQWSKPLTVCDIAFYSSSSNVCNKILRQKKVGSLFWQLFQPPKIYTSKIFHFAVATITKTTVAKQHYFSF